ncbi:thioesterase domain-containing protein [Devosia ginsengisoli]|uniref:thioesterase domain-containing protein n=1 Tax=Devosia ginsengisoli TaxID=400770 RepID=UPI0026EAD892|nr:thioesterase domain-containing protein [Devosia ginsengisoli]MCR6672816.1 thioesterase domain-containing protein [Devosia ginsengisoli]
MTEAEFETYLHDHIPLSRAMAVRVISIADQQVTLSAPLAPNINHRDTVFGGSAASIATLAAWSLLHLRLVAAGLPSRVVIQRSTMDYLAPIAGDFTATATFESAANWDTFLRMLTRKGRARIALQAALDYQGQKAVQFHGEFVALGKDRL